MAISVKAILVPEDNEIGSGLAFIRQNEAKAIDINNWVSADNATNLTNNGFFIKNDVIYRPYKAYLDFSKNTIWVVAREEMEPMDVLST